MSSSKKTAVVLFNLGGPDRLESVRPFLFNLFNDRAIIGLPQPFRFLLAQLISRKREEKAKKIYERLGGKSPLLETTLAQADALEKELSFVGNFKVFVAMRYFHPFASEVMKEIEKFDPNQIILLPLYPQFSSTTTASSVKDFAKKFSSAKWQKDKKISIKTVCCYPGEEDFIRSHALLVKQTIMKFYDGSLAKFRFLFSAHGLPQKVIDAGDPYVFQVEMTTRKVMRNLAEIFGVTKEKVCEEIDFKVCYQSKVGPLKWTSPSLEHEIRKVALDGKIPVIIPISFVSDHSETLVELDIEYRDLAETLGIKNYLRVPALNTDGQFIKNLKEICSNVDSNRDPGSSTGVFSGKKMLRICPKKFKFCPNQNRCVA